MARFHGRKGRPWRRAQARVYAEESHCYLCGRYVDQSMANYRHPAARSVHHLIPPDIAPHLAHDRDNLRLTHLGCNSSAGRGIFEGRPNRAAPGSRGQQGRATRGRGRTYQVALPTVVSNLERDW